VLELSLHILDIVENSVRAGASLVRVTVEEDTDSDRYKMEIEDNGSGMTEEVRQKALDPFFTSKKVRRVGLGLPMLSEAAERTGGSFLLESSPGRGTRVRAEFGLGHIDRQPLGKITGTLITILIGNPDTDFVYEHVRNGRVYSLDTREIKEELDGIPINHPEVLDFLRTNIQEGLTEIGADFSKEDF
jgi:hypothetical protein